MFIIFLLILSKGEIYTWNGGTYYNQKWEDSSNWITTTNTYPNKTTDVVILRNNKFDKSITINQYIEIGSIISVDESIYLSIKGSNEYPTRGSDEYPTRGSDEYPTRGSDEYPTRGILNISDFVNMTKGGISIHGELDYHGKICHASILLYSGKLSFYGEVDFTNSSLRIFGGILYAHDLVLYGNHVGFSFESYYTNTVKQNVAIIGNLINAAQNILYVRLPIQINVLGTFHNGPVDIDLVKEYYKHYKYEIYVVTCSQLCNISFNGYLNKIFKYRLAKYINNKQGLYIEIINEPILISYILVPLTILLIIVIIAIVVYKRFN